jgi:hypothetical protein
MPFQAARTTTGPHHGYFMLTATVKAKKNDYLIEVLCHP